MLLTDRHIERQKDKRQALHNVLGGGIKSSSDMTPAITVSLYCLSFTDTVGWVSAAPGNMTPAITVLLYYLSFTDTVNWVSAVSGNL